MAGKTRAIKNIFYALRIMLGIDKGIVIHTAIMNAIEYFGWVFYDLFFIRYLIGAIENKESFSHIMTFILVSGLVFAIFAAYIAYIEGTFRPIAGVTLYHKLYGMLYKKAGSVELKCYEDSNFFVFFPIIGNFLFGYIYNKMLYKREQEFAPYKRRIDYVNRVMHLADFFI